MEEPGSPTDAHTELGQVPAQVRELARACAGYVEQAIGIPLDGTQDTLPLLDHYLRDIAGSAQGAVLALVIPAAGSYFGEVLRRELHGSRWDAAPEDDFDNWRLGFSGCSLAVNPVTVVREVVHQTTVGGALTLSAADHHTARQVLEQAGAVAEEDYYRLTIRYETIEQVYQALV